MTTTPRAPAATPVTPSPSGPSPLARTDEQRAAFTHLEDLARPLRARVRADPEGFPIIPGRLGQIEWHDGSLVAVYTDRPAMIRRLLALSGAVRHQIGDQEARVLIPSETVPEAAGVIRARRRRTQTSPASLRNLRPRATSRSQDRPGGTRASHSASPGLSAAIPAG